MVYTPLQRSTPAPVTTYWAPSSWTAGSSVGSRLALGPSAAGADSAGLDAVAVLRLPLSPPPSCRARRALMARATSPPAAASAARAAAASSSPPPVEASKVATASASSHGSSRPSICHSLLRHPQPPRMPCASPRRSSVHSSASLCEHAPQRHRNAPPHLVGESKRRTEGPRRSIRAGPRRTSRARPNASRTCLSRLFSTLRSQLLIRSRAQKTEDPPPAGAAGIDPDRTTSRWDDQALLLRHPRSAQTSQLAKHPSSAGRAD